jgi:hypothetical protein
MEVATGGSENNYLSNSFHRTSRFLIYV